ncbi:hypothetical protein [Streptomyces antibioticus]|uniref:hypothetical protein n=1 Tax=Streptomyces antibioticus TaxID=1890 RepID=UPI0037018B1D
MRYRGQRLTPQTYISRDVDLVILQGKAWPRLRVVEWSVDKLASIVQAGQTIADRSDFLYGLRVLLHADGL